MPVLILLLGGCPPAKDESAAETGDDTAETAGETDTAGESDSPGDTDTAAPPATLGEIPTTFVGAPSDASGAAVLLPGDLDGDLVGDVVVGAYYGNRLCWFLGPVEARAHTLDADADGCLTGEGSYDFASYTMASAGDVDGDGTADFLVGAVGNGEVAANAGKAYLVTGPVATGLLADSVSTWVGEAGGDYAGIGLAPGGDLTGDGEVDLIVGASGSDAGGAGGGKAYVLPGPILPGSSSLADAPITFLGAAKGSKKSGHASLGGGDLVGDSMVTPGDLDGDGQDDLVIGAGGNSTNGAASGLVAVFLGPLEVGEHSLYEADTLWYGGAAGAYAGSPVNAGGDLTGDGQADVLVSADGIGGGTVYVLDQFVSGTALLTNLPLSFVGEVAGDLAGAAAVATGDLLGDDAPDVAIGAPSSDAVGQDAGAVYIVAGPFLDGAWPLADAARILTGEATADNGGRALDGGVDVTGDALPDLLIGAIYNDAGGAFSGKSYLYVGE